MRVGIDYNFAINQLSRIASQKSIQQYNTNPRFQTASTMLYANELEIRDKAEILISSLKEYLQSIEPDPKLFFKPGDTVPVPDIHGDFVHLITTLHRHGLLDSELNLKKEFNYVFLGDFYNHGKDSDIVDSWLNKQLDTSVNIYRIAGNHELFFLARDKDGKLKVKLRHPVTGEAIPISANDVENDLQNGLRITEELLKSIKDGSLLAAYTLLDKEHFIPKFYAHTFVTNKDFEKLGVDTKEVLDFTEGTNQRFKARGEEIYERFMDSKIRGKFDWLEITRPLFSDPLFDIEYRDENHRGDALFMRVTGVNPDFKIMSKIKDELPQGVYQIVGHTRVPDFDLSNEDPKNSPLILPDNTGKAFIQFTDIGIGQYYKNPNFERPEISIKAI